MRFLRFAQWWGQAGGGVRFCLLALLVAFFLAFMFLSRVVPVGFVASIALIVVGIVAAVGDHKLRRNASQTTQQAAPQPTAEAIAPPVPPAPPLAVYIVAYTLFSFCGFTVVAQLAAGNSRERWIGAVIVFVFAIIPLAVWRAVVDHRKRVSRIWASIGHCPTCGYDLRASPERCPECGTDIAKLDVS